MSSVANPERVNASKPQPSNGAATAPVQSQATPPVSVVIPTYNAAPLLHEAIQSVLDQTYSEFEVVVIDDGSTDDTEHVIRSFGNRVSYIKQVNQGVGAARNNGIALSR